MTPHSYKLTCEVFAEAEKRHRDLMEPWSSLVGETTDAVARQQIMRQGLGATFRQRYPMPDAYWPADPVAALPPNTEKTTHA